MPFSLGKRLLRCMRYSSAGDDHAVSHRLRSVTVPLDIWLKTSKKYFSTQPVIQLRNSLPYDISDVKVEMHLEKWMDLDKKGHKEQTLALSSLKHLFGGKISCGQQGFLCAMFSGSSIC